MIFYVSIGRMLLLIGTLMTDGLRKSGVCYYIIELIALGNTRIDYLPWAASTSLTAR